MNYVQILLILFQFCPYISTLLYPCQYTDLNELILKCDLCRCLTFPSIYSSSNDLCSLTTSSSSLNCLENSSQDEFLRSKINQISENIFYENDNQIEFYNFNPDLFYSEKFCQLKTYSHLTFYNFLYNYTLNQIPQCLKKLNSLRFINSFIDKNYFPSEKLVFYNTTFNIENFNITSTKILILHTIQFLSQSFEFNSLSSLTHLTITYTENYNLLGTFLHLSYLNLCSTKLNDKKLNKLFSQINLPDLTTLILSNNQLTLITNKFPSTIRYLDLSKNYIKSLDYYSFKTLYSLNILNISFNSQLEIQQDTFTRIPYLEILDLSYTLPTLPFEELFLPLQKLRHLNISANSLDTLPQLPVPYDAHSIESYDHHLPVLYVDLSYNNFEKLDFEIFSTPSTQDKYILSFNINHNRLKTLNFSSLLLFNDTKRRGPFIELDLRNNPLECDCNLYETIHTLYPKQNELLSLKYQQLPPSGYYSPSSFQYFRHRRHYNLAQQSSSTNIYQKQTRIKFLHLSNLTCIDTIEPDIHRFLSDLNSSNSYCSYIKSCPSTCTCCSQSNCYCYSQCPNECTCKHSYDLIHNYINCSYRQLTQIPSNLPLSTTDLYLNNNQIKSLENTSQIFSNLLSLKKLYLHDNPWIPKFYENIQEFQFNKQLFHLTYGKNLLCNRSINIKKSLTYEDCCQYKNNESCENKIHIENHSKNIFLYQKYILLTLILFLLLLICILILYIYRKKRLLYPKETYLSNDNIKKYNQQDNDNSLSYTDEDDYASIPLTISQTDIPSQINAPPLPPPRYFISNRPVSHTSTTSTSITIRSIKGQNLSSTRSCLQIKLDVLVIYSINDSKYIHEYIGQQLEYMYGKRFSFYFLHRDRMLGELDWLIENSCVTLLILRKPYHLIHEYMKILSTSKMKSFIILINYGQNYQMTSEKVREKIAKLYRTSAIYEWKSNPNALIHEQLELFLEQNCGSATYVMD